MKKTTALILAIVASFLITACGNKTQWAFDASKTAYNNIKTAYEITTQLSSDIYDAWRMGIYEKDEILKGGVTYLATELSLSEDELRDGVGYALASDWPEQSDEEKEKLLPVEDTKIFFKEMEDDLFSFCVIITRNAYIANGKIEEAQTALDAAKAQMKELSEKYSDYEYYPSLKGYFTTTSAFFNFCQNPTGSFEQGTNTINDYKNKAHDYISDLDYIFEE